MDRIVGKRLVLVLGLSVVAAEDARQGTQPAAPEQQYQALLKEYNNAFEVYATAFREAKLPEDRQKVIQEKYPQPGKWAAKFLELAEKNPQGPFAEEALIWIVTSDARLKRFLPWHEHTARYEMIWIMQMRAGLAGDKEEQAVRGKAVDMLLRDHVASPKMGHVAQNLSRDPKSATLLRAIVDRNPSREIKAETCLALVRETQGDLGVARQLKENPELARSVEQFYGKDYVEQMLKADVTRLESEGDKLYAELTGKYVLRMQPARLVELCEHHGEASADGGVHVKLPLTQEQVKFSGHAIEVRLYAEDAYAGFLPQTGRIDVWRPAAGPGIRVDHGMKDGLAISPFYDPMIAKVIAHGADREEARTRLVQALRDTVVLGPTTNRHFLIRLLEHPEFAAGEATTAFIGQHFAGDALKQPLVTDAHWALAAALLWRQSAERYPAALRGWTVPVRLRGES
jgi:hypothetical protein